MATEALPSGYEPAEVESRWIDYWREHKTFTPDPDGPGDPYCIVIPPPNVTGALHMGHALDITLQDILCRFHRQLGRKVLWVPGTDHAGIATQNVVERALAAEGVTREHLGREKFIERVWEWRAQYGGRIVNQIKRLGASVDWSRERFTMDEGLSRAVREVFVRLYEEGLIYRGDYIINWCPRCRTALADLEVEFAPHASKIYHIRYPVQGTDRFVTVATTRPETMLGDTAVAVHPEDERYADLVGASVVLPLVGRVIPVIADAYVEREFGTGCLKVTPAHDMNDFELGRKHGLACISVMDGSGTINDEAPETYRGLDRLACRQAVLDDLSALGLLEAVKDYEHNVGECYRCKTVIEPFVSKQWFVRAAPLAAVARKAVEDGRTNIYPEQWTKTYYDWLDNIRDWCISRQIWWGHRIPAWTCEDCGELIVARTDPASCPKCAGSRLVRDEDVLDTWFSSALWPFSTLGWPDDTPELRAFYPTSVLVTGFDILFFWVARMMMMGLHFRDDVPFREVYIHALVRDAEGKKMSKSTGNVIDPLVMVDRYGTDALRFTLTSFAAMGRDIKLSEERIQGYRNFVNKLWNAARFSLMNLGEDIPDVDLAQAAKAGPAHAWILDRLESVKEAVSGALSGYRFNEATQELYGFLWHEFCDWYLEMVKVDMASGDEARMAAAKRVLWTVLSELLTLQHPIMPFVTQEIWSRLPGVSQPDLALMPFPAARPHLRTEAAAAAMELMRQVVVGVRNIRAELGISPAVKLTALVKTTSGAEADSLAACEELIRFLARLDRLEVGGEVVAPKASAAAAAGSCALFVPLAGAVDFTSELARLAKEEAKVAKELDMVEKKLHNESFTSRAPAEVVEKEREKFRAAHERLERLRELTVRIQGLMEA
ncbi:MAG: valine--tRNA ligase [Desulfovibrionaceae bacterium]|nr:valine--tRNA ligase [Desulfovibrionaceae bacterium]